MLHLIAPEHKRLTWYLSAEEYLAQHATEDYMMPWVVSPTVIIGRHQVLQNEVNISYCDTHHIAVCRRKSGGGCVYADEGNLMLSYITPDTHSEQVFQSYLTRLASALQQLGLAAVTTAHNDVLIAGHKVSGNACYALSHATIVHGTLLYDVNVDALQQAITPNQEKLAKHGIASVRQRVANIRTMITETLPYASVLLSLPQLTSWLMNEWCTEQRDLTKDEIHAIDQLEQTYISLENITA